MYSACRFTLCLLAALAGSTDLCPLTESVAHAAPRREHRRSSSASSAHSSGAEDQALLQRGRQYASAKEWPAAIQTFQAAVRSRPRDAAVLSELSYSLLMDKQLDAAQRSAQRAVKLAASDKQIKAKSLYLLGRIAEDRNSTSDALSFYKQSLKLQQDDETIQHIYQLDEFSDAVPCQRARSIQDICLCLRDLLGGNCFVEDDLHPAVKRVRSLWTSSRPQLGTSSAFIAVQVGEGWSLVRHLGRIRETPPKQIGITDMRASVTQNGARYVYSVTYIEVDHERGCGSLSSAQVGGLDRQYDLDCVNESRYQLLCVSSPDGKATTCPVHAQIGCHRSKSPHITDEFEGVTSAVRAKVRAWRDRAQVSAQTQLTVSTDTGSVRGSELRGGPGRNTTDMSCPRPRPVTYRLW